MVTYHAVSVNRIERVKEEKGGSFIAIVGYQISLTLRLRSDDGSVMIGALGARRYLKVGREESSRAMRIINFVLGKNRIRILGKQRVDLLKELSKLIGLDKATCHAKKFATLFQIPHTACRDQQDWDMRGSRISL